MLLFTDVVSLLVVLGLPAVVAVDVITWVVSVGPSTGHVEMQLVVLVLPAVVSVDVITWVVSVGPSTVQVYKQSISIVCTYVHSQCIHCMVLCTANPTYVTTYVCILMVLRYLLSGMFIS